MDTLQQFNIDDIIVGNSLDVDELSKLLFPYVKYPRQAFDRVLKHETELDVNQLHILANHLGVFVSDLFKTEDWTSSSVKGIITFTNGQYKAVLNENKALMSLYKNDKIFGTYIVNTEIVTISKFINVITKMIENYESSES